MHAATCAWLQAIDSARSNGDYYKGLASRFTSTTYTNMDGIVECSEDFDPSMLGPDLVISVKWGMVEPPQTRVATNGFAHERKVLEQVDVV